MITVKQLTKKFDEFYALDHLDMHVKRGSIYGLIGPNGAGKTTLINNIIGVMRPEEGTVKVDGQEILDNAALKQRMLNISDDWYYYGSYTIDDMARFYQAMYEKFNKERYQKIRELFSIDAKKQIRRLSKGMKKQVAFLLALSCMPDVLILDEPLDGLDPVMRKQILNLIINDVSERQMTVLVSSHNLRELEDICDHVGIIHQGKMIIEKPLDDLKGTVHKYQVAFREQFPAELPNRLQILHTTQIGSVYNLIIKGTCAEIDEILSAYHPMLCDNISLTLEELFIYELGGLGYDFKRILV